MKNINVNWIFCNNNEWCQLLYLDLNSIAPQNVFGVYVIWQYRPLYNDKRVIKVGQGVIKQRLSEHRNNSNITQYAQGGNILFVTWAQVGENDVDGVEVYLGNNLQPIIGERFPNCNEIMVNIPQ